MVEELENYVARICNPKNMSLRGRMGRIIIAGGLLVAIGVSFAIYLFAQNKDIERACRQGAFAKFSDRLPENLTDTYCRCLIELTPNTTDYEKRSVACYFIIRQVYDVPFDWRRDKSKE